jgi:hypothetical protein
MYGTLGASVLVVVAGLVGQVGPLDWALDGQAEHLGLSLTASTSVGFAAVLWRVLLEGARLLLPEDPSGRPGAERQHAYDAIVAWWRPDRRAMAVAALCLGLAAGVYLDSQSVGPLAPCALDEACGRHVEVSPDAELDRENTVWLRNETNLLGHTPVRMRGATDAPIRWFVQTTDGTLPEAPVRGVVQHLGLDGPTLHVLEQAGIDVAADTRVIDTRDSPLARRWLVWASLGVSVGAMGVALWRRLRPGLPR